MAPPAAPMASQTLHGSCACGRNRYVVEIPPAQGQLAEVRYDNTAASRLHAASPASILLRVPLHWYTTATFAQFPDETRLSIQRSFVSPVAAHARRCFCGYCGTQLSSWNERTRDEAEHICLTVGSLLDEDQARLGELGFLPGSESSDDEEEEEEQCSDDEEEQRSHDEEEQRSHDDKEQRNHDDKEQRSHDDKEQRNHDDKEQRSEPSCASPARGAGAPWFEDMVRNTRLRRFQQQRGGHTATGVHVEWEVMEWTEADHGADQGHVIPSKRKIGLVEADEDVGMPAHRSRLLS